MIMLRPTTDTVELNPGDTISVGVSFYYRAGKETSCEVVAYIGPASSPVAKGSQEVSLPSSTNSTKKNASVSVKIPSGSFLGGGAPAGTYDLNAYIKGTELCAQIPGCIVIKGTAGLGDMIGMMMVIMMMGMIMPMMSEISD